MYVGLLPNYILQGPPGFDGVDGPLGLPGSRGAPGLKVRTDQCIQVLQNVRMYVYTILVHIHSHIKVHNPPRLRWFSGLSNLCVKG